MPSLSSYDRGKKSAEGRRYKEDIKAGNDAIDLFESTLRKAAPKYRPIRHVVLGNHENRIERAIEEDARIDGAISMDDLGWRKHGWFVHPFLKPVAISQINFVHYCCLNSKGKVTQTKNGAPSAEAQARRFARSTVTGHAQGIDLAYTYGGDRTLVSVIAGSFYQHEERYMGPQGETYWRGIVMLNDVRTTGEFDPMPVSLDYLRRNYG
jgi:hypothetical protein